MSLNLGELLRDVAEGTGLPPDAVDRLPPDIANLEIARPDQLDTAKSALDLLEEIPWILFGLAVVLFAGAIWLSPERRRGVLNVGLCLIVAGIAVLALRKLGEKEVVNALANAPNAGATADDAWKIATSLVVDVAQGSVLVGLFVVTGAWLAGPARWATSARGLAARYATMPA